MPRDAHTPSNRPYHTQPDIDDGGIVRLATLLPIPTLLREKGVDPTELVASVGLEESVFDDGENQMPFRTAGLLLQRCAEATTCPHFGLLVGQQSDVETLGRVGALMRQSPHGRRRTAQSDTASAPAESRRRSDAHRKRRARVDGPCHLSARHARNRTSARSRRRAELHRAAFDVWQPLAARCRDLLTR